MFIDFRERGRERERTIDVRDKPSLVLGKSNHKWPMV